MLVHPNGLVNLPKFSWLTNRLENLEKRDRIQEISNMTSAVLESKSKDKVQEIFEGDGLVPRLAVDTGRQMLFM